MLPLNKFRIKNIKGGEATFDKDFYNAGLCFPLLLPFGCLEQELAVKLEIEE